MKNIANDKLYPYFQILSRGSVFKLGSSLGRNILEIASNSVYSKPLNS